LGGFAILDFRLPIAGMQLKCFASKVFSERALKTFTKAGCSGIYNPFLFNQINFYFLHT